MARTYDDACGTAHALDLVGERWALLVMREMLLGPRRFGAHQERQRQNSDHRQDAEARSGFT